MTELFGPVLGVMKAKDLPEAIALVNQTGYGLTSGLESLDDREQELWLEQVAAGNLYINRVTTGAVVLRQPFGGLGKSAFGPGIKAGGPNYVVQLMDFEPADPPAIDQPPEDPQLRDLHDRLLDLTGAPGAPSRAKVAPVVAAIASYDLELRREFGLAHDHFRLVGQDNLRRYRPLRAVRIRTHPDDSFFDLFARVAAAKAVGCHITVSSPPGTRARGRDLLEALTATWEGAVAFADETDAELARAIRARETDRVRYAARARAPAEILAAAHGTGVFVSRAPVLAEGRIELLWYLREQSISRDYHRYGNLGQRADEDRAEVL